MGIRVLERIVATECDCEDCESLAIYEIVTALSRINLCRRHKDELREQLGVL